MFAAAQRLQKAKMFPNNNWLRKNIHRAAKLLSTPETKVEPINFSELRLHSMTLKLGDKHLGQGQKIGRRRN